MEVSSLSMLKSEQSAQLAREIAESGVTITQLPNQSCLDAEVLIRRRDIRTRLNMALQDNYLIKEIAQECGSHFTAISDFKCFRRVAEHHIKNIESWLIKNGY